MPGQLSDIGRRTRSQRYALWVICALGFVALSALWPLHGRNEMGWDFPQFYLAARLPIADLYNRTAYLALAHRVFDGFGIRHFPPFARPAIFALPLAPLGWLSYWDAFRVWSGTQFACYITALWLLRRIYAYPPEMLLLWALYYPPMHSIWEGQDAPGVLLVVLIAFLRLRAGDERLAGLMFSLCVYKFNLFLLLPLYLLAQRRWQALRYMLAGAAVLLGLSNLLQSPHAYAKWLKGIPDMTINFGPHLMPGLRGLSGGSVVIYAIAAIAVLAVAFGAMLRTDETRALAIMITASLLIAYHVIYYDLTLLAIPIAVSLATPGALPRAASLVLLAAVPLWFCPAPYVAVVVVLLFVGQLYSVKRGKGSEAFPAQHRPAHINFGC